MAVIRSGVLGNIRGKVAGVVGGQWKDKNYLREYVKPANPNTAAQIAQRSKMTDSVAFAKPLVGPIFNAYTDKFIKSMSGFNFFIHENIAKFDGSPVYSNILPTFGKLWNGGITTGTYNTATGAIEFTYPETLGNNGALTDKCFCCCYHEPTAIWFFPAAESARDDQALSVTAVDGLTATDFYSWLFFAKYAGTIVTDLSVSAYRNLVAV